MKFFLKVLCLFIIFFSNLYANKVVNLYIWGADIPREVLEEFETETGIRVNLSTYDSNETMFAKIKASSKLYDIILPSNYFIQHMAKRNMLEKLDHSKIPNLKNLEHIFKNNKFDNNNEYSVPLLWGTTGIFYNRKYIKDNPPQSWNDLWSTRWRDKLILLDDMREIFSISLFSLQLNPNASNQHNLKRAYQKLLKLGPNIKIFASEGVTPIIIDEDATIGSVWNGDAYKASLENKDIEFVYPKEGFIMWADCLAIPKNPPHLEEAYVFINYLLRPEVGARIFKFTGYPGTNRMSLKLLDKNTRLNPILYPSAEILKRGVFQEEISKETMEIYSNYWEKLKLSL